jgi:hypothetical protein
LVTAFCHLHRSVNEFPIAWIFVGRIYKAAVQMRLRMTALTRTKSGTYRARKVIPTDVRATYGQWEAKFSLPATTPERDAKATFTAWLAEVEGRIRSIRGGNPTTATAKATANPWQLFEQYVREVKPAPGTVSTWRIAIKSLQDHFGDAAINEDAAQAWARALVTPERGAGTVRATYLTAAKTIYNWARGQKLVAANPFRDVKIVIPRRTTTRESKA